MGFWGDLKNYGEDALNIGSLGLYGTLKRASQGPAQANLAPLQQAQQSDVDLANQLAAERAGYFNGGAAPGSGGGWRPPTAGANPALGAYGGGGGAGGPTAFAAPVIDQSAANQIRAQQLASLNGLTAAANGKVPSAAELQLRQQASRNMAGAYALAATLQGRSPGGALTQAQNQAALTQAQTNQDAATLRANEQAQARSALSQALQGVRGQDQDVAAQQAALSQSTNQLNAQQYNALLSAQLQAMGYGTQAATGYANASAQNAATQNAFTGGMLNTYAGLIPLAGGGGRSPLGAYGGGNGLMAPTMF